MNDKDFKHLRHKIYLNLSFITLEGIKGLTLKKEELTIRNEFLGIELVNQFLNKGRSVICVCPHYNNWEWTVLGTGYYFPHKSIGIYKRISNPRIDEYIKWLRNKCSMLLLSTHETRLITEEIPKGRLILLMSDQNPSNLKDALWIRFFNQEIPCLHGLEKYAVKYNLPVIYMDQKRISDSKYTLELSLLCENPQNTSTGELTQLFMTKVEQVIISNPSSWLWTHKRWKHVDKYI